MMKLDVIELAIIATCDIKAYTGNFVAGNIQNPQVIMICKDILHDM